MKFTKEELAKFDGREGRPAYAAYNGKVYDVTASKKWMNGGHMRKHNAGGDLTADMKGAPHDATLLDKFPVVGTLDELAPETPKKTGIIDLYFDQHPHPVAVHFPVALTFVSAAFLAIYLFMNIDVFAQSALLVLWAATVMTPPAALTGAVSWWFNYGHRPTNLFIAKILLSLILFIMQAAALYFWSPSSIAFCAGLFIMGAVVGVLGKLGAALTFPKK